MYAHDTKIQNKSVSLYVLGQLCDGECVNKKQMELILTR